MIKYTKLPETMRVDCSDYGFGPFSVLVVPHGNEEENVYDFYLTCTGWGIVLDMYGCKVDNPEYAAEMAYHAAPDYIPEFIAKCFEEDE